MEHKLVFGGEQYLPFARSRIKALRAAGLRYASQQFEIDGTSVKVRVAGEHDFITLDGATKRRFYVAAWVPPVEMTSGQLADILEAKPRMGLLPGGNFYVLMSDTKKPEKFIKVWERTIQLPTTSNQFETVNTPGAWDGKVIEEFISRNITSSSTMGLEERVNPITGNPFYVAYEDLSASHIDIHRVSCGPRIVLDGSYVAATNWRQYTESGAKVGTRTETYSSMPTGTIHFGWNLATCEGVGGVNTEVWNNTVSPIYTQGAVAIPVKVRVDSSTGPTYKKQNVGNPALAATLFSAVPSPLAPPYDKHHIDLWRGSVEVTLNPNDRGKTQAFVAATSGKYICITDNFGSYYFQAKLDGDIKTPAPGESSSTFLSKNVLMFNDAFVSFGLGTLYGRLDAAQYGVAFSAGQSSAPSISGVTDSGADPVPPSAYVVGFFRDDFDALLGN